MATVPNRSAGAVGARAGQSRGAARLGPAEWQRRLIHIAPGFLPIGLWFYPHRDPSSPLMRGFLCSVVTVLGLHAWLRYRAIARPGDRNPAPSVLGYTLSIIATVLLFPASPELGLTVLAVLAFGDGTATLAGLCWGGTPLPWNPRKTWTGLVGFLAAGIPLSTLIYWGETAFNPRSLPPQVSFATSLLVVGPAVLAAALAESLPLRINDNIRVGATAAVLLPALHHLLVA